MSIELVIKLLASRIEVVVMIIEAKQSSGGRAALFEQPAEAVKIDGMYF